MIVWRLTIGTLVILGAGCARAPEARTYQLNGQVLAVKLETREVLVKHGDIPGFMPAMTMPYTVKDPALLKERVPGELITATLTVEESIGYLSAIARTGSAPIPDDARTTIPPATGVHVLRAGDPAPATILSDQDDQPVSLTRFSGFATAVTFIYTRCPLPQFCPLLDRRFADVQKAAAADAALAGRVRLLSVSFDPQFDRAAVLRAHAATVKADPGVWTFATAEEAVVDRFAAEFGVNVIREQDGTITHNLRTAVIDPNGHIAAVLDSNAWTAADLVRELKATLAR